MEQIPEIRLPPPVTQKMGPLMTWLAQQPLEYSSDEDDYPSD